MEWRFRISGAYVWGNHDATNPIDTGPVTLRPGIKGSSGAGVARPTRPCGEDGTLPGDDEGLRREIDNHSRRISLLVGEAQLKDARIKDLESALRAKSVDTLQSLQGSPPPDESEDVRPAGIESELQPERDEQIKAYQQVVPLFEEPLVNDTRLEHLELESRLDAKRAECSQAEQRIALLLLDGTAKDERFKELQSSLDAERVQAGQEVAKLLDERELNGARIRQLESSLASELSERMIVQRLYTSLRQTIQVMVRIRPPLADLDGGRGAANWSIESKSGILEVKTRNKPLRVKFDRVFQPQASNQDIFAEILPLVRQAATEGGRCVFIAHGASSTGKSYTMRGDDKGPAPTPGIIQLTGRRLFDMIPAGATIEASSMFVYNGEVWDLLAPDDDKIVKLPPMEKACTPATKCTQVWSADDLVACFNSTMSKTVKAATRLNAESSRGHYFFTIRIIGQPGLALTGVLTFVDLAGNESVRESGVQGQQFEESKSINSELFLLAEMIRNLRRGKPADSRRSRLTQLLAGAMGHGADTSVRSETLMLSTVNLSGEHSQKSVRTLEFAQKVIETPAKKAKA